MELYLPLAVIGAILGAFALLLWKSPVGQLKATSWVGLGVGGVALGIGLAYGLAAAFAPPRRGIESRPAPSLMGGDMLPPGNYPNGPLKVGDKAPRFEAQGWLNGPAPVAGAKGSQVIVVDLWAHW